MGHLASIFLILTTDLYVFELNVDEASVSADSSPLSPVRKPPFKILINVQPRHFSDRFPKSWLAVERIANATVSAFTMRFNNRYEYIVFVYLDPVDEACMLAVDVHRDTAAKAMCDGAFAEWQRSAVIDLK